MGDAMSPDTRLLDRVREWRTTGHFYDADAETLDELIAALATAKTRADRAEADRDIWKATYFIAKLRADERAWGPDGVAFIDRLLTILDAARQDGQEEDT